MNRLYVRHARCGCVFCEQLRPDGVPTKPGGMLWSVMAHLVPLLHWRSPESVGCLLIFRKKAVFFPGPGESVRTCNLTQTSGNNMSLFPLLLIWSVIRGLPCVALASRFNSPHRCSFGELGCHQTLAGLVLILGSVFSAGKGVSSVNAWYSTAPDIQEVPSETRLGEVNIFDAGAVKPVDTFDRDILLCAFGRSGLPCSFRRGLTSPSTIKLGFALSLPLVWVQTGQEIAATENQIW